MEYSTNSLQLVAALVECNHEVTQMTDAFILGGKKGDIFFNFNRTEKLIEDLNMFWQDRLPLKSALSYITTYKRLLDQVKEFQKSNK